MKITTIGLDLAKTIFHLVGIDHRGTEQLKKKLRRSQLLAYFAQLPACVVAMEACAGSNYWYRQFKALGHTPRIIATQRVKPYLDGNKNDYNDARAIAEAATRANMRFVTPKTHVQQELQTLLRMREMQIDQRTALCNQMRSILAEQGLVAPQGMTRLKRVLAEALETPDNGLTPLLRELLADARERLRALEAGIDLLNRKLEAASRSVADVKLLQSIPGYGPVVASAMVSAIGDGKAFRRGRDVAASVGLVPRQFSTGGKTVLLGISKRGDGYLRQVLIHGARSVILQAAHKDDRLSRWVTGLCERRGKNRATVALANKLARIGWAVLRRQTPYCAVAA